MCVGKINVYTQILNWGYKSALNTHSLNLSDNLGSLLNFKLPCILFFTLPPKRMEQQMCERILGSQYCLPPLEFCICELLKTHPRWMAGAFFVSLASLFMSKGVCHIFSMFWSNNKDEWGPSYLELNCMIGKGVSLSISGPIIMTPFTLQGHNQM